MITFISVVLAGLVASLLIFSKYNGGGTEGIQYIPEAPKRPVPPPLPSNPPSMPTHTETLYQTAKASLGKHMKLDPMVPNLLACASSLSGVLVAAGYTGLPHGGIAGTSSLYHFLSTSPDFEISDTPDHGCIIMSQSGIPGAHLAHGHVGILGDNGIMSNDSDSGVWRELWTLQKWQDYYHTYGGLPVTYFRWK